MESIFILSFLHILGYIMETLVNYYRFYLIFDVENKLNLPELQGFGIG